MALLDGTDKLPRQNQRRDDCGHEQPKVTMLNIEAKGATAPHKKGIGENCQHRVCFLEHRFRFFARLLFLVVIINRYAVALKIGCHVVEVGGIGHGLLAIAIAECYAAAQEGSAHGDALYLVHIDAIDLNARKGSETKSLLPSALIFKMRYWKMKIRGKPNSRR